MASFGLSAKEVCRGRWGWLLPRMGVPDQFLSRKHGPCPVCGGKDRYRWDDRDGTGSYFCSVCGPGDGFMLAERVTGKKFKDLYKMVENMIGTAPMPVLSPQDDHEQQRARMKAVWDQSCAPAPDGVVARYLTRRVGSFTLSGAIREAAGLRLGGGEMFPAMVAKVATPQDRAANLHITFLTPEGEKAPVEPSKRVMSGPLPAGSAIRLSPAAETMGVAEGIETALAAAQMYQMPVWSVLNAGMLKKWVAPPVAKRIFIFGDNDQNFTGQAAAYALAEALSKDGGLAVEVCIPKLVGQDWADVLMTRRAK